MQEAVVYTVFLCKKREKIKNNNNKKIKKLHTVSDILEEANLQRQ